MISCHFRVYLRTRPLVACSPLPRDRFHPHDTPRVERLEEYSQIWNVHRYSNHRYRMMQIKNRYPDNIKIVKLNHIDNDYNSC